MKNMKLDEITNKDETIDGVNQNEYGDLRIYW